DVLKRPQDPDLAVQDDRILQLPCISASPLLAAVENRDVEMVSLLLEARASVTEEIADVAHADFQLVNLLLDAGGPATGRCLYYASSQGRLELVRWLLEAGADESYLHFEETRFKFHSTSPRRSLPVGTPLFVASGQGHLEVVQLLLKAGADQNEATLAGTPLYVACSAGHTQIVQLLLEAGADEDVGTETETPLYIASLKGHAEATRCLLNSRADVNRGNGRETPLYAAASRGHVDTVRLLLQAGADRYKGDDVPTTTTGRLVAICTFYAGVVLVAIMLTIVGGAFAAHYPKWIKNNKGKETAAVSFRKSTVIPSGKQSGPGNKLSQARIVEKDEGKEPGTTQGVREPAFPFFVANTVHQAGPASKKLAALKGFWGVGCDNSNFKLGASALGGLM
ncbi:ANK1, partial [Symbiodinium microadriaticum]